MTTPNFANTIFETHSIEDIGNLAKAMCLEGVPRGPLLLALLVLLFFGFVGFFKAAARLKLEPS